VLIGYLLAMVGVGVYFTKKNKNTDQFFRGGKQIPWWAAGCSIFATMLSSLTYTGLPSKSFAQDWVYAVGNMTIPLVAIVAVFVALPFYRRIDATSAYEYLEKRFSRGVRLFGSGSFTLFHIFRMAVVMSLTGLALSIATPLTPAQSVLLMGVLSIIYCTMGGIEAVIWTDTIQTFVLFGGALLAIIMLMNGSDGGWSGSFSLAAEADKFRIANFHWDMTSTQIAFWVIVIGGIGQNLSSYTADQAVVQRYMTTSSQQLAARSIWTNAVMTIPATLLFFGIGTALFAFYHSNPHKLDPTITTDQVFPLFIAHEMPIGLAGLIVAGVFAAAQSTVSTSMNSTATTIVTDFMRPFEVCKTERGYLAAARVITCVMGIVGTLFALFFINPEIKSLFDAFLKVIGLFMGVLGGLFVLGVLTRRANATGAMVGAAVGAMTMFSLWRFTTVNGYLYTTSGIVTCVLAGYLASLLRPQDRDLTGLTLYTS
jgi:SSS family transporter